MFSQLFNILNPNFASTSGESPAETETHSAGQLLEEETVNTSFETIDFPFENVAQKMVGFEKFKNSVAELASPPPFHDKTGAAEFAFSMPSWIADQSPATLICASAEY